MNRDDFKVLITDTLNTVINVLVTKGSEYTISDENVFHNFNKAVNLSGGVFPTNKHAAIGFMTKHIVSLHDLINDEDKLQKYGYTIVDEKIGDIINYLILIKGMLYEDIKTYKEQNGTL